eukprot:scaffold337547_cov29-Prasinocladus_malaysianus.AAC.1
MIYHNACANTSKSLLVLDSLAPYGTRKDDGHILVHANMHISVTRVIVHFPRGVTDELANRLQHPERRRQFVRWLNSHGKTAQDV